MYAKSNMVSVAMQVKQSLRMLLQMDESRWQTSMKTINAIHGKDEVNKVLSIVEEEQHHAI